MVGLEHDVIVHLQHELLRNLAEALRALRDLAATNSLQHSNVVARHAGDARRLRFGNADQDLLWYALTLVQDGNRAAQRLAAKRCDYHGHRVGCVLQGGIQTSLIRIGGGYKVDRIKSYMQASKNQFIAEFEPIRGLAALTVALMHSFYVLAPEPARSAAISYAKLLFNGYAAVTIFFLLSGVVLGLALDRYAGTFAAQWRQFLILRVFRIYPMIVVITSVICLYLLLFHHHQTHAQATEWFNRYYQEELSWYRVLQNFLLINVSLNPVGWTLMVEMAMACIFPLLHRIARSSGMFVNIVVLVIMIALAFMAAPLRALAADNQVYVLFCELVLSHAYKFYLGLLLPMYVRLPLLDWIAAHRVAYFIVAIVVLAFVRPLLPQLGASIELAVLVESLAAVGVLAPFCSGVSLGIGGRLFQLSTIRWLGHVSYSFYLWHFVVLYMTATAMLIYVPAALLAAHPFGFSVLLAIVSIAVTGVLSEQSFRHVEIRYMRTGRDLARTLATRSNAVAN